MKKSVHSGSRIVNLRELGGYKGRGGLTVRRGLLFRSGGLDLPPGVLAEELARLRLSLVFDLRSREEAELRPYTLPSGVRYRQKPVFSSLGKGLGFLNPRERRPLSKEELRSLDGFMHRTYEAMGENPVVFGGIINEIVENGGRPLLFHCAAGKDRTGVLASMILLALGVSTKDVIDHYMLSNEYRREAVERETREVDNAVADPVAAARIKEMLMAREEFMELVLEQVRLYPSFDDYARERMGLSAADLEGMRRIYLE
ncbi:MAG: tyrosine-protein phosphatase [Synergistaceae bacterium]|nr:tyrosine-protein phosphatase [Synergistaceae bacterium]